MSEYSHTMYYNMFSSIIDRMDPEELLETSHAIYREVYGEMRPPPVVDLTNDSDWNVVMVPGPFRSDQNFRERTTAMGTPLINDQEQLPCATDSHIRPQVRFHSLLCEAPQFSLTTVSSFKLKLQPLAMFVSPGSALYDRSSRPGGGENIWNSVSNRLTS